MRCCAISIAACATVTGVLVIAACSQNDRAIAAIPKATVRETVAVAFSPDGKQLFVAVTQNARIFDAETGKELHSFDWDVFAGAVAFSPDRKQALVGSGSHLWLCDMARGKKIREFEGHTMRIFSVAVSPDGKQALSGGQDTTARLWDTATGRAIRSFGGTGGWENRVDLVGFSPDGKQILIGAKDLSVWELSSGKEICKFGWAHVGPRYAAYSPDGKQLVVGDDGSARMWNTRTWKLVRELPDEANSATFSPDSKRLWVLVHGQPRVLDAETGTVIHKFESMSVWAGPVVFSPDGKSVAAPDAVRDANTGKLIWQVPGFDGF